LEGLITEGYADQNLAHSVNTGKPLDSQKKTLIPQGGSKGPVPESLGDRLGSSRSRQRLTSKNGFYGRRKEERIGGKKIWGKTSPGASFKGKKTLTHSVELKPSGVECKNKILPGNAVRSGGDLTSQARPEERRSRGKGKDRVKPDRQRPEEKGTKKTRIALQVAGKTPLSEEKKVKASLPRAAKKKGR